MTEAKHDPLLSVIIPVWNGSEHLKACLTALLGQSYSPLEVIAVDNASSDGSARLIEEAFPSVQLLRNRYNLGFSGGCNVGLRAARGDVLVLLNQDTQVRPDWAAALAAATQDPAVGVVGSLIFYPDGERVQHAGAWMEWPLGLAHHEESIPESARAVEWVTGAALAFRREVMERVGLLDEGFWPGYFEDADFCFRVRAAGYTVRLDPAATLLHHESTSVGDPVLRSRYYQRGRLRLVLKHLPPERWLSEFVPAEEAYQQPAVFGHESEALRLAYLNAIAAAEPLLGACWHAEPSLVAEVTQALQRLHRLAWEQDWQRVQALLGPLPVAQQMGSAGAQEVEARLIAPPEMNNYPVPLPVVSLPRLEPWSLRPLSLSGVGKILGWLYALWYGVTARRGDEHLMAQQERINWTLMQVFNQTVAQTLAQQQAHQNENLDNLRKHQMTLGQEQVRLHQEQAHLYQEQARLIKAQQHVQDRYIQALEQQLRELATEHALLARELSAVRQASEGNHEVKTNE